ncbi:MAG: nuclear transport factor 2 family protein [Betaproteobacteria bacterium]|nr:nuclear transport factor 2 family protein [Betaproteobacteria bacterium]
MLKRIFAVAVLLIPLAAFAQRPPSTPQPANPAILKAIDADVWIPYSKAFAEGKANDYIALHSKSLLRVMGDLKFVDPYEGFTRNMAEMFDSLKKQNVKVSIQFRFTERIANQDTASERGIYEFVMTDAKGKVTRNYSRFHNFLKKEGGKWKIVMDYDNGEKGAVTEATFKAAFARDDYAKY